MDLHGYEAIDLTRDGQILIASFDRPEQLNAINSAVHRELETLFVDADRDDGIKLVILTGKGRAFSAGGDLDWLLELNADPAASARAILGDRRIQSALLGMETPIIAKVNGAAVGLGCSLALFCDVVVAASHAIFSDPHVSVGLVAGDGGALLWPQLIGFARAKEYLFTGDLMTAAEAERIGLINHAVAADQLDEKVYGLARRLAGGAMRSIRWTKQAINVPLRQLAHSMMDLSLSLETQSNLTKDHQEAVWALAQKRRPNFTGR